MENYTSCNVGRGDNVVLDSHGCAGITALQLAVLGGCAAVVLISALRVAWAHVQGTLL